MLALNLPERVHYDVGDAEDWVCYDVEYRVRYDVDDVEDRVRYDVDDVEDMSSASHSAGSSGWLAPKTGAGPTFQWAGKVDAICRSRSNRAKRPRAGCILRIHDIPHHFAHSA